MEELDPGRGQHTHHSHLKPTNRCRYATCLLPGSPTATMMLDIHHWIFQAELRLSSEPCLFNLLPPLLTHFPVLKACNKSPLLCQEFGPRSSYFIWAFYQVKAFSYPKKEFLVSSLKVINFPLSSYKLGYPFLGLGHLHTTLVIPPPPHSFVNEYF